MAKTENRILQRTWKRCTVNSVRFWTTRYDSMDWTKMQQRLRAIWALPSTKRCCSGRKRNTSNLQKWWWTSRYLTMRLKSSNGAVSARENCWRWHPQILIWTKGYSLSQNPISVWMAKMWLQTPRHRKASGSFRCRIFWQRKSETIWNRFTRWSRLTESLRWLSIIYITKWTGAQKRPGSSASESTICGILMCHCWSRWDSLR